MRIDDKTLILGSKKLNIFLAASIALATSGASAATEAYWTGGSGGTETKPLILDSNCYTNSSGTVITPSGGGGYVSSQLRRRFAYSTKMRGLR